VEQVCVKATGNGTKRSRKYELDSGIGYKPAWPESYICTFESRDTAREPLDDNADISGKSESSNPNPMTSCRYSMIALIADIMGATALPSETLGIPSLMWNAAADFDDVSGLLLCKATSCAVHGPGRAEPRCIEQG
jgi:hypothetical protein